jgi:hypothetical protein
MALVVRGIVVRKGIGYSTGRLGEFSSMRLEVGPWRFLFFDLVADIG